MIKKILCSVLVTTIILAQTPLSLFAQDAYHGVNKTEVQVSEVKYSNTENVKLTLKQLRKKFPHEKYWNHADDPGADAEKNKQDSYTSIPCKHKGTIGTKKQTCNGFQPEGRQLSWQCMGYAEKLGYDATGENPRLNENGWFTDKNVSALDNLKPGDIVRYKNNGHSIYITGVKGDVVTYTDCNTDGCCVILWDQKTTKSEIKKSYTYVRIAPFEVKEGNISIENAEVTLSKTTYTYNGKTKKPTVKVILKGKTLKKDRDYTVSYKNTKNIGTGKVIITGMGDYEGTITKSIQIKTKAGTEFFSKGYKYRITSVSNSTVSFVGVSSYSLKEIIIPETVKYGGITFKVTTIGDKALKSNAMITKVVVGESVKTIGDYAFYGCTKLSSVSLGSRVTVIEDYAFSKCLALKSIVLPEKVTKIDKKAFCNSKNLKSIKITSTGLKQVGDDVFKGIHTKAQIKVPAKVYSSYKVMLKGKGQSNAVVIKKI